MAIKTKSDPASPGEPRLTTGETGVKFVPEGAAASRDETVLPAMVNAKIGKKTGKP